MPAHNEGHHLLGNIRQAALFFGNIGWDYELIVVDDGSTDDTYLEASKAARDNPRVRVIQLNPNEGKGFALRYGFVYSKGDLVAFLDADLDLQPSQIENLYHIMTTRRADVVIGSKNHPDSKLDYPLHRRMMSTLYYLLVRILFHLPVKDTQTGVKLFRREVLERAFPRLLVKRYAFDLELLVNTHHMGYKIAEAPVTLTFRRGWGRINWRDIVKTLIDTAAIFYRLYIMRYYDRLVP